MTDLFEQRARAHLRASAPLAERMRPESLDEVVGQEEVIGPGSPLRSMLAQKRLRSMILWGPPGTGKTTLARLIAGASGARMSQLSAAGSGVKEVRDAIAAAADARALSDRSTVLFVDEIHRFNKTQQDVLLHAVEDGTVTLIGATTENPSFEVNSAILSRCQLLILRHLNDAEMHLLIDRAIGDTERGIGGWNVELAPDAAPAMIRYAQGDARSLLNALELSAIKAKADLAESNRTGIATITAEVVATAIGRQSLLYDKTGEEHYNVASALIKSMRGSDPNAAIYYAVRMLAGGEDPKFLARRMAIFASEDIGNADPKALELAAAAVQVVTFIGMPESYYTLTQLAAYLALAPKSGAAKQALYAAQELVKRHGPLPVPMHIRNAPTGMMKQLGYGAGGTDPHAELDGVSAREYLPDAIAGAELYRPVPWGFEKELARRMAYRDAKKHGGAAAAPDTGHQPAGGDSPPASKDRMEDGI